MKPLLLKYGLPLGLGLVLLFITALGLVSTTFTGCVKQEPTSTSSGGGCGTTMGCCPATGCGRGWLLSCDGLCYATTADAAAAARAQIGRAHV